MVIDHMNSYEAKQESIYNVFFQYCSENRSPEPAECPTPEEGCSYAVWWEGSGWCHLAGNICPREARPSTLFMKAGINSLQVYCKDILIKVKVNS